MTDEKVSDREPEPPTITRLAFHLGFSSLKQMGQYEAAGKFAELVQRARLRIMADYEKKLLTGPPSGVIFALKGLGWNDQDNNKLPEAPNLNLKAKIAPRTKTGLFRTRCRTIN